MKRALTLIAAAGFMGLLVVVANASSSIVISGGGSGGGITQAQADQWYLKNDAGAITSTGGALSGHLAVDGGATINNGLSIGGVSGTLIPSSVNIAVGKTIAQLDNPYGFPATNANDGNLSTFSHTNNAAGEWIAIDLAASHVVREMIIRKNGAMYGDRPANFKVQKSDDWSFTVNVVDVATVTGANEATTTVTLGTPTAGRYWRLLDTNVEYLEIVEWEIYESLAGPLVTIGGDVQVSGDVNTPASVLYYGAVCDGSTDDTTAIQNALNSSNEVELPAGATCVVGNLTVALDGTHIYGHGAGSVLKAKTGFSGTLLTVGTHPVTLENFALLGPSDTSKKSDATGYANVNGISINSQTAGVIDGLTVHGFTGYGIFWTNDVRDRRSHFAVTASDVYNNQTGIYLPAYAEYQRISAVQLHDNRNGMVIAAGNVVADALSINDNGTGVTLLGTGWANNGHGTISSSMINHSAVNSVYCKDITIGFAFSGVQIHDGPILLDTCSGVSITDGVFDVQSISAGGGGRNIIRGNFVYGAYSNTVTHSYGGTLDDLVVAGNYYATGTPLAEGAVFTNNSAAVTYPDAILIDNRTAATAGVPYQNPGCIRFAGHGYSGGDYIEECRLCFDGGALGAQSFRVQCKYAATGWVSAMTLSPYSTNSVTFPYGGSFNGSVALNAGTLYTNSVTANSGSVITMASEITKYTTRSTALGATACDASGELGQQYWLANSTHTCVCQCAQTGAGAYAWTATALSGVCAGTDC